MDTASPSRFPVPRAFIAYPRYVTSGVARRDLLRLPLAFALPPRPWPAGTFLQFWARHLQWDSARWSSLWDALALLGVHELVVQWARYDSIDYLPLVLRAAAECRARGWGLHFGLSASSAWWTDLDAGPDATALALRRAAEAHAACAHDLRSLAALPCFRGWYLPEEIDDVHWSRPLAAADLARHIRALRSRLRPLAVSGFSTSHAPAAELAAFWRSLRRQSSFDQVFFQDGIGAGSLTLAQWERILPALSRAVGPKRLRVVVETFQRLPGPGPFAAQPAPPDRIHAQCRIASEHSRRPPLAFSLADYQTPESAH
jgi:hypothetical protein